MSLQNIEENLAVLSVDVKDMRWPTSLGGHGSDAMVSFLNENSCFGNSLKRIVFSTPIQITPVPMLPSKRMASMRDSA